MIPWCARYSTTACVMAAMWSSLNEVVNAEPRWPEVPNTTFCAGSVTSG